MEKQEKLYGNKQEIAEIFGVNVNTLSNDLTAMRRLPEFAQYVLHPGYKRVNINIDGYEKFLRYKADLRLQKL